MQLGALCGMSENEFWNATPRFMSAKIKALESLQRLSWEQSRYIAFHAIKVGDTRNRLKQFTDIGRFPWETVKFPKVTKEQLEQFSLEADEVIRSIHAPKKEDAELN